MIPVHRTCTEVLAAGSDRRRSPESHPLKDYRDVPAYVLLGDPGAGKTTAFKMEYEALADSACLIDARDFVTFDPEAHHEWRGKTLFIDALDEVRAGSHDARTPFDAIRSRLDKLGRPRFRLSCREADWLRENDRKRLASVAPHDSRVTVLRLDPLQRADVKSILDARTEITDARGFIDQASARGVDALLGNPLTLRLLADVVSRERRWPRSRLELFELAGMLLTTERNKEHITADPQPPSSELLDAAGRLCAVLLISGATGYALGYGQANAEFLDISQCEYEAHQLLRSALATRLFTARAEGCFAPVHRHIAEFVGAKHLARVIREGLPASRIIALLTGYDGGVLSNLRAVAAWLAALSEDAQAEATTDRRTARDYLRHARDHGVPLDILLDRTRHSEILREEMSELLVCHLRPGDFDASQVGHSFLNESEKQCREFIELVRSNVDALHENRCPVGLLHELAVAYFGLSSDVEGPDPRARISDLCDSDELLIDATLAGLRGAPFRKDTPDTRKIIGLLKFEKEYLVALPWLAGIDELDDLRVLSERQLRQGLAFHFCSSVEDRLNRQRRLLELDHEAGAEMLVRCTSAKMRSGVYDAEVARHLATDEHASVARRAVLPLLRAFPVRCSQPVPLIMLDDLLVAALWRVDRTALVELITKKRSRTSMSVSQRVHWLAAEVVATGDISTDRLREFVQRRERRIAQLAEFLFAADSLLADLPAPALACFIRLLAPSTRPLGGTASHLIGAEYKAYRSVERMIKALAVHDGTDGQTVENLELLAADPTQGEWRYSLAAARDRQRVIRRDAAYRHPTVVDVCQTLSGGAPASACDLAALLVDRFASLGQRIRSGDTDDWRQYWNVDEYGRPLEPRPENVGRDALLSDLEPHLPPGVRARREGSYSHDKRADIFVTCRHFEVPVEIKRSRHKDLWSAMRNQLIAQYTNHPATDGYGIFLAFWFGRDYIQPPPEGSKPADPDELRARLGGTLTEAERRKISVVVIDVSRE